MYPRPSVHAIVVNLGDDVYVTQAGDPAPVALPGAIPAADLLTGAPGAPPYAGAAIPSVENYPYIRIIKRTPVTTSNPTGFEPRYHMIAGNTITQICKRGYQVPNVHRMIILGAAYNLTPNAEPAVNYTLGLSLPDSLFPANLRAQNVRELTIRVPMPPTVYTITQLHTEFALMINSDLFLKDFFIATVVGMDLIIELRSTLLLSLGLRFSVAMNADSRSPFNVPYSTAITVFPGAGLFPTVYNYGLGDPGSGTYELVSQNENYMYQYTRDLWRDHTHTSRFMYDAIPGAYYDTFCITHHYQYYIGQQLGPENKGKETYVYVQAAVSDVETAMQTRLEEVLNKYAAFYGFGITTLGIPSGGANPFLGPAVPNI